jgi:hypothetical protein
MRFAGHGRDIRARPGASCNRPFMGLRGTGKSQKPGLDAFISNPLAKVQPDGGRTQRLAAGRLEIATMVQWLGRGPSASKRRKMTKVGTNGGFDNPDGAVAVCKLIVDECLEHMLKPGMTAEALFDLYAMLGEDFDLYAMLGDDPVIPAHAFSALDYAKERCEVLTQPEIEAPPIAP